MATNNQMSDHVSKVRAACGKLMEAAAELDALRKEWDYAGMGYALPEDLTALGHPGLVRDDVAAAYTSAAAARTLLDAGHGTNLVKVKA